jgi:uncharacterized protein
MDKNSDAVSNDPVNLDAYRNQTLKMLRNEKTLVLAVHDGDGPWVAPVYYLYAPPGIYFYSSPRSKHIQALRVCNRSAGAIFVDDDQWQDIQGLQMVGTVEQIRSKMQRLKITARYLTKFPLASQMLMTDTQHMEGLDTRVELYVFRPSEIHCTFNRQGFGRRVPIEL